MISSSSGPTSPLRPLGLGEVLDRAVSLSVRAFVLLALIYLVLAVPRAVIQYLAFRSYEPMFAAMMRSLNSHGDPNALAQQLQTSAASPLLSAAAILFSFVIVPLPIAALTIACTTVYFGGTMTFADAYRAAVGRWLPLILLNVMWIAVAGAAFAIVTIVAVIVGIGVGALLAFFKTVGIIFATIASIAAVLFVFAFALLVVLAWQLSVVACVVERSSFIEAFISGTKRVMSGIGIRRSLLVGLVFALIYGGLAMAQTIGTYLLVLLVHQTAAGTVYATVFSVITQVLATAFMVIFYFDLRVREDGLDLELAAAARAPQGAARA